MMSCGNMHASPLPTTIRKQRPRLMASASDLANLAAVKAWLSIDSNNSDPILPPLITATSSMIYAYLSRRSIVPRTYTESYDGGGGRNSRQLVLRNYPVLSVS